MDGSDEVEGLAGRARQARADGRHAAAAALWRDVLRRRPEDWRAALELKQDLASGLHYSESDPLFRRAARHLPDDAWLAHYGALFAFHTGDLDALEARARAVAGRRPGEAGVQALLGDVARQRRDWELAARAFAAALALEPGVAGYESKLCEVRMRRRVARWVAEAPRVGAAYAVAVVNLDRNRERLDDVMREFGACEAPVHRIPGVEGSRLALAAVRRLVGVAGSTETRGTLGCFLSHAAAWEAMLARGLEHCLVIEDDVVPLVDLPARIGPLGLPEGYDVCFVNDRLEPRLAAERAARMEAPGAVTLADALRSFPPDDNAPGADGYFVSAAGARRLLAWVAEDGFDGDVDWRLLAYGLTGEEVTGLATGSHAAAVLGPMQRAIGRRERLRAHVLCPALIRTVPISSDREDENRV